MLRAGFYWEAHEVWESVWLGCAPNSRGKALIKALIQFSNARLKARMGRPQAAARLIEDASRIAIDLAAERRHMGGERRHMGVDLWQFRQTLEAEVCNE